MQEARGVRPLPQGLSLVAVTVVAVVAVVVAETHPDGEFGDVDAGSAAPLQCYRAGPMGNLNCFWGAQGDPGASYELVFQSQKYNPNMTKMEPVPAGQNWVNISRAHFTEADKLLVWVVREGRPVWLPILVDLETEMKPDVPQFVGEVDLSEDQPLDAILQWEPPKWPRHTLLTCQFRYQRCPETNWTLLQPHLYTVEMHDLDLTTRYEVSGRCQVRGGRLWSNWSQILTFQTPPSAPKEVWVSGNFCKTSGPQALLLLWKAPGPCVQVTYTVWFWVRDTTETQEGIHCCQSLIPAGAQWAAVHAVNAASWAPFTNLSLVFLAPESAPRNVTVTSIAGNPPQLLVTWQHGTREPLEYVVDWIGDEEPLEKLNWTRLPGRNFSAVLSGNFTAGVPFRISVTGVFPGGLAPAPTVWAFGKELEPKSAPAVRRLPDNPPGTPVVAWEEMPRSVLRGHLTQYTLCVRSQTNATACENVSRSVRTMALPNLRSGPWELWVTASTTAGQGPKGHGFWLHLPDNGVQLKVLPAVLSLGSLFLLGLGLATAGSSFHLSHKVLPRWAWEKVPDPAHSSSNQPHIQDVTPPPPPSDTPVLEVQEMEPRTEPPKPQVSSLLHSGYEKHFLPTPEELGLLRPSSP